MKTKILKNHNNNFLNNQNYIFWKTEKKKLLNKFFIENFKNKIYLFLTKIDFTLSKVNSDNIYIIYVIFIWMVIYLLYFPILYFIILLITFIISFTIQIYTLKVPVNYKIKIIQLNDYFIDNSKSSISMNIILLLIGLLIISWIPVFFIDYFNNYFWINLDVLVLWFLGVIAPVSIFYFYRFYKYLNKTILIKLKLLNIILFPFFICLIMIYWFYSLLLIFIFNSDKKYRFLKLNSLTNLFKEFNIINIDYAKNKNYIISKK